MPLNCVYVAGWKSALSLVGASNAFCSPNSPSALQVLKVYAAVNKAILPS